MLLIDKNREDLRRKSHYIKKMLDIKEHLEKQYNKTLLRLIDFSDSDPRKVCDAFNEEIAAHSMTMIEDGKLLYDIITPYVKMPVKSYDSFRKEEILRRS